MNRKKISSLIAIAMLISNSANVIAEIPNGTVIINDTAYDLDIMKHKKEILQSIGMDGFDEVIVKDLNGNFKLNRTGQVVNPVLLPSLIYKGEKITEYMRNDGEEIGFKVEAINVVASDRIEIIFNKKLSEDFEKIKIAINNEALGEKDEITYVAENIICIKLSDPLESDKEYKINITKDIIDEYRNELEKDVESKFMLINKSSVVKEKYNCDVYLMDDNMKISNVEIVGDLYIAGENITSTNLKVSENIYLMMHGKGITKLNNSSSKSIIDMSKEKSKIELENVKSNKLVLNGENTNVSSKVGTLINNTCINNSAIIDTKNGKLGIVDIETKDTEQIEFKGDYKDEIRVWTPVEIVSNSSELKRVVVNSNFSNNNVKIDAKVETLVVNTSKPIDMMSSVFVADCYNDVTLNLSRGATLKYVVKNNHKVKVNSSIKVKEVNSISEVDYKENTINISGGGSIVPEKEVYNIVEILPIKPILAEYETPVNKLNLPNHINVKVKFNDKEKQEVVKVAWDTSKYNPYKEGEYLLNGILNLEDSGLTNTNNLSVQVKVIVGSQFIVDDVDIFFDKYAMLGTKMDELELPEFAQIMLTNGQIKDIPVKWDKSMFVENEEGKFTIYGDLDLSNTIVSNPQNLKAEINIIVGKMNIEEIEHQEIIVTPNTPIEEIKLGEYVEVVAQDKINKKMVTERVKVDNWTSDDYSSENEGCYTFTANLNKEDLASKKLYNDKELKAGAFVEVAKNIRGVKVLTENINKDESRVTINIKRPDLKPNMTITIYNENGQLLFKDQVKPEDKEATFTTVLPFGKYKAYVFGIGNYKRVPIEIELKSDVQDGVYNIVSVNEIGDILVPYETTVDKLNLPSYVIASIKGNEGEIEREIEVIWSTSNYNPYKSGEYVLIGELQVDGEKLTNTNNIKAEVKVIVDSQFIIDDVDIFYDQYVRLGTTKEELSLPEYAQIMVSTGQIKDVPVIWDMSTFEENKEGMFTIVGELDINNTALTNPGKLKASINIIVEKAIVESIEKTKTIALQGTEIEELNLPDVVKVLVRNERTNTTELEMVRVDRWTSENYNRNENGEYIFTATLNSEDLRDKKVINIENKKAEAVVKVCHNFDGINLEITPVDGTENKVKITIENESLKNNLTLTIYDLNGNLMFKDQTVKEGNKAIFETILNNGEYIGYVYGIEDYLKIPIKMSIGNQNNNHFEDKYVTLDIYKKEVDISNVEANFNIAIKQGTQYREQITVRVTDLYGNIIYIEQLPVVGGKISFASILKKGTVKVQINTHNDNERSLFIIDLTK